IGLVWPGATNVRSQRHGAPSTRNAESGEQNGCVGSDAKEWARPVEEITVRSCWTSSETPVSAQIVWQVSPGDAPARVQSDGPTASSTRDPRVPTFSGTC